MSIPPTPSQVALEWFQKVWNERDDSAIDSMLNPKAMIDGISVDDTTTMRGAAEFRIFHRAFLSAIPDMRVEITKVIEQDDWVSVRFVCHGTHQGEGLGAPPSHQRVEFSSIAFGRVENASGSKAGTWWISPRSTARSGAPSGSVKAVTWITHECCT